MPSIEVTDEAVEVLRQSLELARVDPTTGGVRLRPTRSLGGGSSVQVEMAEGAGQGEKTIELEGVRLFIDPALEEAIPNAIVDVEPPHGRIVVRPATSG